MYTINFSQEALLPRERLVSQGAEKLSNQELLANLLRTGTKKENVLKLTSPTCVSFLCQSYKRLGGLGR